MYQNIYDILIHNFNTYDNINTYDNRNLKYLEEGK